MSTSGQDRTRVIVTTDPELDDLNSMLRLVLYSNEIELAGLVYSASQFHYAGDPARGIAPFRWPPADYRGHIDIAIDAYAQVHANLVAHDERYPTPEHLRSLVRQGNVADVGDTAQPTPGSDLIRDVLLDDQPGRVVVQAWGGHNTIARALMSIEEENAGSPDWPAIHARVSARTLITAFGEQDSTFAEYIRPHWPEMEFHQVATMAWGYFAWDVVAAEDLVYLGADWMRENVSTVGPIGASYRVWGDGIQMAEGFDAEDYFGHRDLTVDQLKERGYKVWAPLHEPGAWISEGDSSNFALFIDNGLRNAEHPSYGGWGGRQVPHPDDPHQWVSVHAGRWTDEAPGEVGDAPGPTRPDWGEAGRWLGAFQRDLAGRLRWSVTPDRAAANHHPVIDVLTGLDATLPAGGEGVIRWAVADPDGDAVTVRAFQYVESGTCEAPVTLEVRGDDAVVARVPADAAVGNTVHVILEATDDGAPPLTTYARVILTVA